MCNLITPSEDILKRRKDELSETDFKLEHLTSDQKQLLLETLLDRLAAFSNSLKTIGCTDRVIPTFNFRSHNPIKTLPFEIPHAIPDTIKEELNELIEAGLIHRNISQWLSPMILVKKKQNPTNPHKPTSYSFKYNLTVSPEKCVFFKSTIDYLGFNISLNKIQPITSNILKITSFQPPRTVKQVRRFLGLCSFFYRSLIPGFAELTECLTQLTRKNVPIQWTPTHQEAFKKLQDVFFTKPFVRLPDWDKPFVLKTDASGQAISSLFYYKSMRTNCIPFLITVKLYQTQREITLL
ncbi:Retrovirus-related Pol polyprotein from transposon 412 [Araneus ventricosus]|uniref:RNA-directed DNA polymerase n=1 Tax=Araneus ventricosus TaxID=182803 RepID=A0A4Y2H9F2_ARAVE|nr:Retrovirus-related Pol polyprotein from transposon 412 [Araneus ventricosus]